MRYTAVLKFVRSEALDDWWLIERAVEVKSDWMVQVKGPLGMYYSYQHSGRISDADVEGTSSEMLDIARAIVARGGVTFKRCAVMITGDVAEFWSPRNSTERGAVPLAAADKLAREILMLLDPASVS